MNSTTWYGVGRPKLKTKTANEQRVYTFSFLGMLPAASSITAVSPVEITPDATDVPLVCEAPTIVNHSARVRISAGTEGSTYYLRCTALTSDSDELVIEAWLFIDPYDADTLADGAAILVLPAFTSTGVAS